VASLGANMVTRSISSATRFATLIMLHDRFTLKVLDVATATCARACMTAAQSRAAGNRAPISVSVYVLVTMNLYPMTTARNYLFNDDLALDRVEILRKIAMDIVFDMITGKSYVVHHDHTSSAILSTSRFLTSVIARHMSALTRLLSDNAPDNDVHNLEGGPCRPLDNHLLD
jgi:hypothetical protein